MAATKPQRLSLSQARRIALAAQGFDRPRPSKVDRRHLRRVMATLGVLQLDTIPIVCRPQHLVPFSRLGPYDPALLDRVAYADDEWMESWAHEAALIPVEAEPLFRWRQADMAKSGHWSANGCSDEYVEIVYRELADRGPLLAKELSDPGTKLRTDHAWGGLSEGRMALGRLFAVGRAGSRRIGNFDRQYDLAERIVPADVLAQPTPTRADAQRELLRRAARAHGVGTAECFADYFRISNPEARPLVADLVESGELLPVEVEGWASPAYRWHESKLPRRVTASALLSPFDPVVWFRARGEQLFDFRYRIEIYVPEAKREYGYYVLPFLFGERLCARVDLKADRKAGTLLVKGAWFEAHADADEVAPALGHELEQLARFQGLSHVEIAPNGDAAGALRSLGPRT